MNKKNQALLSHILQEFISLSYCCKITLVSGTVAALTDTDRDLEIDGTSYKANPGIMVKLIECSSGTSTANIESLAKNEIFSEQHMVRGIYDNAQVEIFAVNHEDISQGSITLFNGTIEEVTLQNGIFKAALRGKTDALQNKVGTLFSPQCRAQFCDKACALNAAQYALVSHISTVKDVFRSFKDVNLRTRDGYYKHGSVTFLSGKNKNFSSAVQNHAEQCIYLATSAPYSMSINDRYYILAGCDKSFRTCVQKFDNAKNFRGEPHIPNTSTIYENLD